MGYELSPEETKKPYVEVSGRKGLGVKADDLIDRLEMAAETNVLLLAFDFKDALSFEGETGPYCQYAVVRIRGIRRKGKEAGATEVKAAQETVGQLLAGPEGNGLWELLLATGSLDYAVEAAIATQEPAFVAKYAFQLAQAFNLFYHKHHILSEADEQKRAFLLRLTELVEAQLVRALGLLGIEAPEKM